MNCQKIKSLLLFPRGVERENRAEGDVRKVLGGSLMGGTAISSAKIAAHVPFVLWSVLLICRNALVFLLDRLGPISAVPFTMVMGALGFCYVSCMRDLSESKIENKEQQIELVRFIALSIICLVGAQVGQSPWVLFAITNSLADRERYPLLLFAHIIAGGARAAIPGAHDILDLYPISVSLACAAEYLFSERKDSVSRRLYQLSLAASWAAIAFSCIRAFLLLHAVIGGNYAQPALVLPSGETY